jgi:hypothetical protein
VHVQPSGPHVPLQQSAPLAQYPERAQVAVQALPAHLPVQQSAWLAHAAPPWPHWQWASGCVGQVPAQQGCCAPPQKPLTLQVAVQWASMQIPAQQSAALAHHSP